MSRVNIAVLKAKLSHYIAAAVRGEDVIVMDRKKPVAKLVALKEDDALFSGDDHLRSLVAAGSVQGATKKIARDFFKGTPKVKTSLIQTVLDERDENRF